MRVLLGHANYRIPGGEDRYVAQLSELLKEGGYEVVKRITNNGEIGSWPSFSKMIYSFRDAKEIVKGFRVSRPDLVHINNIYPTLGPALQSAAYTEGIPTVMTVHNYRLRCPNGLFMTQGKVCRRCESGIGVNPLINRCFPDTSQAVAYSIAAGIHRKLHLDQKIQVFLAPSQFMLSQLLGWNIPQERIILARYFVTDFNSSPLGDRGLYLGRLSEEKGVDVLLNALRLLNDPPFVIAGDGPARAALIQMKQSLGLRNVTFTGALGRPDVLAALRQARYVVLPSRCYDNAPLAALEAMAFGRPLAVAKIGGLPELIAEGSGVSFQPNDAQSLAVAIDLLMGTNGPSMGKAAGDWARREVSPSSHLIALREGYRRALEATSS